jgi:undecaprenyl-diphosphatase
MQTRFVSSLARIYDWDVTWCLRFNRTSHIASIRIFFRTISRLGNGVFWYTLMLALLVFDWKFAGHAVAQMILTGLTCTLIYKWLKAKTLRPRPFQLRQDIFCAAAPLDQFSFPSGHTLHAVAFTIVALAYYPMLAWLLIPFTLLIAASRLILGLHYPSDVLAGAAIGTVIASLSFCF